MIHGSFVFGREVCMSVVGLLFFAVVDGGFVCDDEVEKLGS